MKPDREVAPRVHPRRHLWLWYLVAMFLQASLPGVTQAQGGIDLDNDGQPELLLYTEWSNSFSSGGSQQYQLDWKLVPTRTNSIWNYTAYGSPFFYTERGYVWSETNSPAGNWSLPGSVYILESLGQVLPGKFDGPSVFRNGLLGTYWPGQAPTCFMVVRFGTASGWRLAWLELPRFESYRLFYNPQEFSMPAQHQPVWIDFLDVGVNPGPAPARMAVGVEVVPREQRLKISIQSQTPTSMSLLIESSSEGFGDMLEWSPNPVEGPWKEVLRNPRGVAYLTLGPAGSIPYLGAVYFRLR